MKCHSLSLTCLLLATGIGCAENTMVGGEASSFEADEAAYDTGSADTGTDMDNSAIDSQYWGLQASLSVQNGALAPQRSTFQIDYWGDSQRLCTTTLFLDANTDGAVDTEPLEPTESEALTDTLFSQWTVQLSEDSTCNERLPEGFSIGIGKLDAQLIPSVIASDLKPETLNGIYVQGVDASNTLYVFGVIGTQSQYDGQAGPLTDPPIPDGVYFSEALYLLPLIDD